MKISKGNIIPVHHAYFKQYETWKLSSCFEATGRSRLKKKSVTPIISWQDEGKRSEKVVTSCQVIVPQLNTILTTQWFNITPSNPAHQGRFAEHWQNLKAPI